MKRNFANINFLSSILSFILFCGCFSYVLWKAHDCINKYLRKPESMDSSYKSIWDIPLPSVTFCAMENPTPYNENLLKQCIIGKTEYQQDYWASGTCPDSEDLRDKLFVKSSKDLGFFMTFLSTYKVGAVTKNIQSDWTSSIWKDEGKCHTLTLRPNETLKGIKSWSLGFRKSKTLKVFIHEKGSFDTEMPGIKSLTWKTSNNLNIDIHYERIKVLHYNGQPCTSDLDYDLSECRENLYQKVSSIYNFKRFDVRRKSCHN